MAEQIKAEERLARFIAGLSPHMQQELLMALQGYHEQFYNELVAAPTDNIVRAQGKVQAIEVLNKTIMNARTIVTAIDNRRNLSKPPTLDPATTRVM